VGQAILPMRSTGREPRVTYKRPAMTQSDNSTCAMNVLMLSPEPPYPLEGGGAYRIASLLHYFARFAEVDLILISDSGAPALLAPGLVRSQQVIPLPHHSRGLLARYARNAGRAIRGVPPLIDRVSGLGSLIERAIAGRTYDLGVVEHFWCAPYIEQLRGCCETTILDLHNIESVLHDRCARLTGAGAGLVRAGHRRFASASRNLEADLFPRFSLVLATSIEDAAIAGQIAPQARTAVYPNSLPWVETPQSAELPRVVFSANFEYHPNIDAVGFLVREIWPLVRTQYPGVRLRLVGRGDAFIRHLLPPGTAQTGNDTGIEVTGPILDARAEIAQAQIVVAPLRVGSGTRIKILEAWAAARCVVATPLAAEGLGARAGVDIALAGGAHAFASEVIRLLGDPPGRKRIATHGRQTFERCFSWEAAWKTLDKDLQPMPRLGVNRYTKESDALRS
jgi:glycosyltransferase involved in cell wall biosynthesis